MSLIDQALKAAQREKSRLDAESGRPSAPVLVRLRTQPRQRIDRNHILIGSGVVVTIAAVALWIQSTRESPLPNVPPVTSTILTEALSDSVRLQGSVAEAPPRPMVETARADAAPAVTEARTPPLDRPPVSAAESEGLNAVAARRADSEAASARPADPAADRAGTLRISVERPRANAAADVFAEAIAAHRAQEFARAKSLYERVLAIAPSDGDALNNLGVILTMERDFDRAFALLRRAVIVAPKNAGAWNNLGNVLREKGEPDEAVAAYRRAIAIEPRHQGARIGLAQQYLSTNALAQARELLEEVLRVNPALAEAHYTLGQVLELQGERPRAIAAYSAFVRFAPDRLATHVELVRRRIDQLSAAP